MKTCDEDSGRRREAVDLHISKENSESISSLQPTNNDHEFNALDAAKTLSAILDKQLEKQLTTTINTESKKRKRKKEKKGVKLFRSSRNYVSLSEPEKIAPPRLVQISNDFSDADYSKCSEVAVNGTDILNKIDVKNWSTKTKGTVFHYKSDSNGTLTLIDLSPKHKISCKY